MAADTVTITPDTLTLNGFTMFNIDPNWPGQTKRNRLTQFCFAAENLWWISNDLITSCLNGNTRAQLVRLLNYYSAAMRRGWQASNFNRNQGLSARLLGLLNLLNNNLLWSKVDLTAFPAVGAMPPVPFDIPNQSPLELLVKARIENVPPVVTVDGFRNVIRQLTISQQVNARYVPGQAFPDSNNYNCLPWVLFECVFHQPCVVGTSLDIWAGGGFVTDTTRVWRTGRFPEGGATRLYLTQKGTQIFQAFDPAVEDQADEMGVPANMTQAFADGINTRILTSLGKGNVAAGEQFGYHCSIEGGRSFAGRAKQADATKGPLARNAANPILGFNMFDEICRCWKCRYLHHYRFNESSPPLTVESYRQTALYCNVALSCAEDLVQLQCVQQRPAGFVGPNNPNQQPVP